MRRMLARLASASRLRMVVWLAALVSAGALTMLSACFNPTVQSGGLLCSNDPAHLCPSGYTCVNARCWKNGELPPGTGGGGGGATGGSGTGGQSGTGGGAPSACTTRPTLCGEGPAANDACNPICQTGACDCNSTCSVADKTSAICRPLLGTKVAGDFCNPAADDCGLGLVCQTEKCGTGLARCYRFCDDPSDCGGAACNRPVRTSDGVVTGFRACDLAQKACDPYGQTGCGNADLVCYVTGPTTTRCDCPPEVKATEGQSCLLTSCATGLFCVGSGGSSGTCRKLCRTAADCPRPDGGAPGSCSPVGNFGYCVF